MRALSAYNEQMSFAKTTAILALFSGSAMLSACGGSANTAANSAVSKPANENANAVRSNVEELGLLVNVSYDTDDIAWKEDAAHKKIIAVLLFNPADSAKIVTEAEKIKPAETVSLPSQTWYPAELIAQSETGGGDVLNGRSYAANQFFQEPYTSGRIVRVENTDYFILELSSK